MLVIDKEFVQKWARIYDERFKEGKAESEERAIRDWLSNQKAPKYLDKEYFVRLGRWKSARVTKYYEANDDRKVIEVTRAAYLASNDLDKLRILTSLRGVGVPVGATILHYLQPNDFPIFDFHARKTLQQAGLWSRSRDDASTQAWLDYVGIMRGLSSHLDVSLRKLDKALFAYDKRDLYLGTKTHG